MTMSDNVDKKDEETPSLGFIGLEDMLKLREAAANSKISEIIAQKAALERDLAKIVEQNTILKVYVKYRMTEKHSFDDNTGEIKKGDES
jgi:hypothetical protein